MDNFKTEDQSVRKYLEDIAAKKEEIVQAFIAQHGFSPDECEIIERGLGGGRRGWRIQKRSSSKTHPTPEEIMCINTLDEAFIKIRSMLPEQDDFEINDVRFHISAIRNMIMARSAMRVFKSEQPAKADKGVGIHDITEPPTTDWVERG